MIKGRENGQYCGRVDDSRDGVIEGIEAMEKLELT
jgi:hypothetical protein